MTGLANKQFAEVGALLRGEAAQLGFCADRRSPWRVPVGLTVIVFGAGMYGAGMGCWRAPLQALYVAIKFPLIILITTLGNAMLNAMLAPLLGLNISLRQSMLAVLFSFTVASAILGAFSPLTAFMVWNTPSLSGSANDVSIGTYNFIQLTHVAVIAFSGVAGNLRLAQFLQRLSGNAVVARRVLLAWLVGNLFLGSQLCWILRPFIGAPGLPVEVLRASAFKGNFYEAVFSAVIRLLRGD